MSTLLQDIQVLVDETGGSVFWTPYHIYDAANEALLQTYANLRHRHVSASLVISANTEFVALPATIMIPQYILGTEGKYFLTTQAKLEQYSRTWKTASTGTPKHFVVWDAETLRVYPKATTQTTYTMHGVPWPSDELTVTNEDITDSLIKEPVTYRTVALLLEYTQPQLSDIYEKEAQDAELRVRQGLRNRQSHNIRRLHPGKLLSKAYSGHVEIGRKFS